MDAPFSWNRIVQWDLINKYQYRFETGIYEDVDFSLFML